MTALCKYSDVFGAPGTGAHSLRVGGLAAADLLVTGGAAFLVTRYAIGSTSLGTLALVFVLLILIAVATHEAFCVNTRLNAAIFGRPWPSPSPVAPPPKRRAPRADL